MSELKVGEFYDTLPDEYLRKVLNYEGGYTGPNGLEGDRGKSTNRGITSGTLLNAQREGLVPYSVTIKSLTTDLESVRKIYEHNYYLRGKANKLPHTLAFAYFDACVNNGLGGGGKFLQRTINSFLTDTNNHIKDDGGVGTNTLKALDMVLNKNISPLILSATFNNFREKFYYAIVANRPSQKKFLNGWLNRLNSVRKYTENA